MNIYQIIKSFTGPRLFRIHKHGQIVSQNYTPNWLEAMGDSVIKWMRFLLSASYWTSPIVFTVLYKKGAFTMTGLFTAISYGTSLSILLFAAFLVRGIGRVVNPEYQLFMRVLIDAQKDYNLANKRALAGFDSEFWAWPVDFYADQNSDEKKARAGGSVVTGAGDQAVDRAGFAWHSLSSFCASTFGIRMMYPGKTSLINALVSQALQMGRAKLIEETKGSTRNKLKTRDGNEIDSLFVDRRNERQYESNGGTLVVCCEGNSGFYEIGSCVTPLDAGYSVLGWNHPGFSGSTGCPWPSQEQNAIDCVMQFAITKLGFKPEDIVLYAWSIGAYSASWAAMTYPDVKHVVLDATFDDVLPLAVARMPESCKSLVEYSIRQHINLNNAEQIKRYPGPVLLIRRSRDEMITTINPTVIASNRGNDLLLGLLRHRYPDIVDDSTLPRLKQHLATAVDQNTNAVLQTLNVDGAYCESLLRSYAEEHSPSFPMYIRAANQEEKEMLALYLAVQYMRDFNSTHCVPLPGAMFTQPWSL